jgi:hypothetical protein
MRCAVYGTRTYNKSRGYQAKPLLRNVTLQEYYYYNYKKHKIQIEILRYGQEMHF